MENSKPQAKKKGLRRFFVWLVITIAASVIGYYVKKIIDGKKAEKYVALVISEAEGDESFKIPTEFLEGFTKDGVINNLDENIKIIRREDLYSIEQAKIVADELVEDENCILIIGNSNSQLTEITLNSILKSDNRPAFLLPIATADNILLKAKTEKYHSILRMVPDNTNQASSIGNFILSKKMNRIAILVDEDNSTYSNNLSTNISALVRNNGGQIVLKRNYGNSNRLLNNIDELRNNGMMPELIVFVGVSSNGLLLIDEINSLKLNIPILFTDGCTVQTLIEKARKLPAETYFVSAVSEQSHTYTPIGIDASALAKLIIERIEGGVTRKKVSDYVEKHRGEIVLTGKAGAYVFNADGNNTRMNFQVYPCRNNPY